MEQSTSDQIPLASFPTFGSGEVLEWYKLKCSIEVHYQAKLTIYAGRVQDASENRRGRTQDAISTLYRQ
uniref:Uncharacterized protein n=1 Tax=Romanomermis culicivorax TaxID=13658 RepID=A0A915HMI5_ROMCU